MAEEFSFKTVIELRKNGGIILKNGGRIFFKTVIELRKNGRRIFLKR